MSSRGPRRDETATDDLRAIPADLHPAILIAREAWRGVWPGMELEGSADVIVMTLAHHGFVQPRPQATGTDALRAISDPLGLADVTDQAHCVLYEDNDAEAFAALPECPACDGTGKDVPDDFWGGHHARPDLTPDAVDPLREVAVRDRDPIGPFDRDLICGAKVADWFECVREPHPSSWIHISACDGRVDYVWRSAMEVGNRD